MGLDCLTSAVNGSGALGASGASGFFLNLGALRGFGGFRALGV